MDRKVSLLDALDHLLNTAELPRKIRNRIKQVQRDAKAGKHITNDRIENFLIEFGGNRYTIERGETVVTIHESGIDSGK